MSVLNLNKIAGGGADFSQRQRTAIYRIGIVRKGIPLQKLTIRAGGGTPLRALVCRLDKSFTPSRGAALETG